MKKIMKSKFIFGSEFKAIRVRRGLTQKQYADKLGTTIRGIRYRESGRIPVSVEMTEAARRLEQELIKNYQT